MNRHPEPGDKLFVSLSGNPPLLLTITGSHYHTYLKENVMDFERLDGSKNWTTYDNNLYFPEIPIDQPYIYFVCKIEDNGYDGLSWSQEEQWFFTVEEAFKHATSEDHIVEVRKVV